MILCDKKATARPDAVDGLAPLPVTQIHVPDSTTCTHEITSFSVADMAIITRTSIKIDAETIFDRKDEYETSGVVRQLRKFAADSQTAGIIEHDWSKFKELEFQDMCKEKQTLMESLNQYQCTKCPDLTEHYALVHEERTVRGKIAELQHIISDQNLELLPDYHQRVEVLKILNYIDSNSTVQLKGRVAAEISTADELILTELILENTLAEFEPSEIVALLSCFVFQERKSSAPNLTPRLTKGMKIILDIAARVADVQASCGLPVRVDDYKDSLKFGLVEVVYEWAQGMPFKGITGLTDVLEGSIVRCIVRLDETCREVRSAARMIGDAALYKKMEEAQLAIKRDIVFAASLYFN